MNTQPIVRSFVESEYRRLGIDPPKLTLASESSRYRKMHAVCPKCGRDELETTCMGQLYCEGTPAEEMRDNNLATCRCGWSGEVHDMVPAGLQLVPDGIGANRLLPDAGNPREVAFIEQWKSEHANNDLLDFLMRQLTTKDDPNRSPWGLGDAVGDYWKRPLGETTDRDRVVAATVIQWLGSNCGMAFMDAALGRLGGGVNWPQIREGAQPPLGVFTRSDDKETKC